MEKIDRYMEIYLYSFGLSGGFNVCFGIAMPRQLTPKGAVMSSASHSLQITPVFLQDANSV